MSNENKNNNKNMEQETQNKSLGKKLLGFNPTYKLQYLIKRLQKGRIQNNILTIIVILVFPYFYNLQDIFDNPIVTIRSANYKYTYDMLIFLDKIGLQNTK
jgi:hypothetical protein